MNQTEWMKTYFEKSGRPMMGFDLAADQKAMTRQPVRRLVAEFVPPVTADGLACALRGWLGNNPKPAVIEVLAGDDPGHPLKLGLFVWEYPEE